MGGNEALVEIIDVPDGEAPLWVREKWVGLRVPLAPRRATLVVAPTAGVLSGPRTLIARPFNVLLGRAKWHQGYFVPGSDALQILALASPEAAAWWSENAPHVLQPGRCLLFQATCARLCDDAP
jgi:hypothetical protein